MSCEEQQEPSDEHRYTEPRTKRLRSDKALKKGQIKLG